MVVLVTVLLAVAGVAAVTSAASAAWGLHNMQRKDNPGRPVRTYTVSCTDSSGEEVDIKLEVKARVQPSKQEVAGIIAVSELRD
jgi:hypothetical protein